MSPVRKRTLIALLTLTSVLVIDQIIKIFVKTGMRLYESIDVTGWFQILFVQNDGMAFGMDFIGTIFLAGFRVIAVAFFGYILYKLVKRGAKMGMLVCWACVVAGAAGNIIDNCLYGLIFSESTPYDVATFVPLGEGYGRFLSGEVVDMFYFPLFNWPDWMPLVGGEVFFGAVFNFADAAISCGAVALLIFYHKYVTLDYLLDRKPAEQPDEKSNV